MALYPKFVYSSDHDGITYHKNCPIKDNYSNFFRYLNFSSNLDLNEQLKHKQIINGNVLCLILDGEIHLNWGEYRDVVIKSGEMFFLPRNAEVTSYSKGEVSLVAAVIKREMNSKELIDLRKMDEYKNFDEYVFRPLKMHPRMVELAESVKGYLACGVSCAHLHEAKFNELYVILHWFYSFADNAQLFYPMASANSQFKEFIVNNYTINASIEDLANQCNMSRSTFDRKFKETFNTTPLKWIEEHTREIITQKAAEPNVTVKDIMYEVGIYNASQFTQLCKRLCGTTPSRLIHTK